MTQRKTQTAEYWQDDFTVTNQDIELVYHALLEQNQPINIDDIAVMLVRHHCDAEERATRSEFQEGTLYQPKESYEVQDKIVFPKLDFAVGTVTDSRAGHHPEHGNFTIITVTFDENGTRREFAADFPYDHPLNLGEEQSLANLQGLLSPEELYQAYQTTVRRKIRATLQKHDDFVDFHDQFFLQDMLPEFHEGLFNIADAAIDINQRPLSIDALIEQMGLADGDGVTDVQRFSVSYQLANDERFDDVGPAGQVLWYLERIEPPEAHHPPRRLQIQPRKYDVSLFDDDLRSLLADIDDEITDPDDTEPAVPEAGQTTIVLNYPHWRVGTLPLTPKTRVFFPASKYNPVLFEFVDGRTGNTFPGWTVSEHNYVFGLDQWYQKNKLPVGAYIIIKRTKDPMQVVVDYQATRTQRDWVRMASTIGQKLTFQMNPAALSCKYDELMIISDSDPSSTDGLWLNAEERNRTVVDVLCQVFPELSKLNPQSTVHAKTLYSAVNVILRTSPGVIFQELVSNRCFIPMNHGYWTYDPALRD